MVNYGLHYGAELVKEVSVILKGGDSRGMEYSKGDIDGICRVGFLFVQEKLDISFFQVRFIFVDMNNEGSQKDLWDTRKNIDRVILDGDIHRGASRRNLEV